MSARRQGAALAAAAMILGAPAVARACAACAAGANPASRLAFFLSTTALSLLPLGMFGAGFLWVRARMRERFADEFTERDAGTPPVNPPSDSRPATTAPNAD